MRMFRTLILTALLLPIGTAFAQVPPPYLPEPYADTDASRMPAFVQDHFPYGSRTTNTHERYPDREMETTLRSRMVGDNIAEYTLTVENHSRSTLRDVDVTHIFHAPVEGIDILSTAGGRDKGDRLSWDLGHVAPHEYRVLTYQVGFNDPLIGGTPIVSNVKAESRNPSLVANASSRLLVQSGGPRPIVYNFDAVRYPDTGVADLFFSNADEYLTPMQSKAIDLTVFFMISGLLIAGASSFVNVKLKM